MSTALTTNVDQRLLKTTKFPPDFNVKVDMRKVNTPVIKNWVADQIAKLLDSDDDVVPELVFNMLDASRYPKIKDLQIALGGFLGKDAPAFCLQLWKLCISAEQSPQGVPKELLEAKKQELEKERIEEDKAREAASRRQQSEREHDRRVDDMRRADRFARNERRGADYHDRPRRDRSQPRHDDRRRSPSPNFRRRDDHHRSTRHDSDRYVPDHSPRAGHRRVRHSSTSSSGRSSRGRGNGWKRHDHRQRRRSPLHDRRSRSRSPGREHYSPPRRRSDAMDEEKDVTRPGSSNGTGKRQWHGGHGGGGKRSRKPDLTSGPQRGSDDDDDAYRRDKRRLSRSPRPDPTSTVDG